MPTLRANFRSDLLAIAGQHLAAYWGEQTWQISDDDVLIKFFDSWRRLPSIRPRRLWVADDFRCPLEHTEGWRQLQGKIVGGEDLCPHLSRRHARLDTLDGLLNEWGVHHLHLGTAHAAGGSGYMQRSGPVLFARITETDFYAINVYTHGEWENASVLESLHRNWPDAIKNYRIRGIHAESLTTTEHRNLRRVNVQTATATRDGAVYMAIGGVASSGTSAEAVMRADMLWSDAEQLGIAIETQFERFLPYLRAAGYTDQAEIDATLVAVTSEAFQVAFPRYGVLSNVALEGGWFHGRRPSSPVALGRLP
jgi:hypothetical protein